MTTYYLNKYKLKDFLDHYSLGSIVAWDELPDNFVVTADENGYISFGYSERFPLENRFYISLYNDEMQDFVELLKGRLIQLQ